MQTHGVDAVIVPSADPHLSEYLPEYWQGREWLSGFTGSMGTLVVTADVAGLWTDSRYWVQAEQQLQGTGIDLYKLQRGQPDHVGWLAKTLHADSVVAIDGDVLSVAGLDGIESALSAAQIELAFDKDLLAEMWDDRPALPVQPVYAHDDKFVSESAQDKLARVRQAMSEKGASHHLLSSLDDIAWLTNLRGADVDYNPVFLAHMLITDTTATVFVDDRKLSDDMAQALAEAGITVARYEAVKPALGELTDEDVLLIDPSKVAIGTLVQLTDGVGIVEATAPSTLFKSQKSAEDLAHIREAMRQDGAALCEFFAQFEARLAASERLSELDVDEMLLAVRSKQPNYVSPSFPTIAGYNENGALPHYRALADNFSYLDGDGLLLIDSGAQYQNGTTDITRMVGIGQVSAAQKRDVTLVLKSHIALASACFPEGIASPSIDAIGRAPLWAHQLDYGHGTGHGVGYFLNVHEGPQAISYPSAVTVDRAMKLGMLTSIEPGLYREGQWGIRIENLAANVAVAEPQETGFGEYLQFDSVTLCPIDTRLLDMDLLSAEEKHWLNDYHQRVHDELAPRVTGAALAWLRERTQAV